MHMFMAAHHVPRLQRVVVAGDAADDAAGFADRAMRAQHKMRNDEP